MIGSFNTTPRIFDGEPVIRVKRFRGVASELSRLTLRRVLPFSQKIAAGGLMGHIGHLPAVQPPGGRRCPAFLFQQGCGCQTKLGCFRAERSSQALDQHFVIERLPQKADCSGIQRAGSGIVVRICGHQNDWRINAVRNQTFL
jgi:hypothetical protein